jgi:hypothetical protein
LDLLAIRRAELAFDLLDGPLFFRGDESFFDESFFDESFFDLICDTGEAPANGTIKSDVTIESEITKLKALKMALPTTRCIPGHCVLFTLSRVPPSSFPPLNNLFKSQSKGREKQQRGGESSTSWILNYSN